MRKKSLQYILLIALFSLIVGGVGFVWLNRLLEQKEIPKGAVTLRRENPGELGVNEKKQGTVKTHSWKTYNNPKSGISFKYPSCLTIRKDEPGSIDLVSEETRNKLGDTLYKPESDGLYYNMRIVYSKIEDTFGQWKEVYESRIDGDLGSLVEGEEFKKTYGTEGLAFYEFNLMASKVYLFRKYNLGIDVEFTEENLSCVEQKEYDTIIKSFVE